MEDFEKKYKEALGWMREVYPTLNGSTKDNAEQYFPELKENEDERIRKLLADYFSSIKKTAWIYRDITCEQILEWLEKQKDITPIVVSNEDWNCQMAYSEGYQKGMVELNKQKPAEWSEEDKENIELIATHLDNLGNTAMANILRNLHPQPHWKPSEEQMEALEDAKMRMSLDGLGLCPLLQSLIDDLKSL